MEDTLVSEQFRQQLQRRAFVVTLLDQDVQHLAFVIDRAPEIQPPTRNSVHHRIKMPATSRPSEGGGAGGRRAGARRTASSALGLAGVHQDDRVRLRQFRTQETRGERDMRRIQANGSGTKTPK